MEVNGRTELGINDHHEVHSACKSVSPHWKDLGGRLGVLQPTLDIIEADNKESVEKCMSVVIDKWLRRPRDEVRDDVTPTWRTLCDALSYIDGHLAENVAAQHGHGFVYASPADQFQNNPIVNEEKNHDVPDCHDVLIKRLNVLPGAVSNPLTLVNNLYAFGLIPFDVLRNSMDTSGRVLDYETAILFVENQLRGLKEQPQEQKQIMKKFCDALLEQDNPQLARLATDMLEESALSTVKQQSEESTLPHPSNEDKEMANLLQRDINEHGEVDILED